MQVTWIAGNNIWPYHRDLQWKLSPLSQIIRLSTCHETLERHIQRFMQFFTHGIFLFVFPWIRHIQSARLVFSLYFVYLLFDQLFQNLRDIIYTLQQNKLSEIRHSRLFRQQIPCLYRNTRFSSSGNETIW